MASEKGAGDPRITVSSMSALFEILGKAVIHNPADLLIQGLCYHLQQKRDQDHPSLDGLVDLLVNRRLESAELLIRRMVYAESVPTTVYLAGAALAWLQDDLAQALQDLQAVYRRQPSHTIALYALGYCHERLGEEGEAIKYYQDCLKFKNNLPLPAQRLAALYLKQNRLGEALKQYDLLCNSDTHEISPLLIKGYLHLSLGQNREAIDTFGRAIVSHPDNVLSEDHDLDRFLAEGNFDEALAYVDGLLDLQPSRIDLFTKRGDILQFLGDMEQAQAEYRQALTLSPNFIDASIKLGTLYMNTHHFYEASAQFNHALEIHERIIDAYLGLSIAHEQAGEHQQALAGLSSASMIQPNSSLLFFETARMLLFSLSADSDLLEVDRQDAAMSILHAHQGQLMAQPNNPASLYRLGQCQLYLAGPDTAIHAFSAAQKHHPQYVRANAKLAICMYVLGDEEDALKQLRSLSIQDSASISLYYQTAMLYGEPVKFAATLMNLSKNMAESWAHTDPTAQISVVLENLGIADRESSLLESLQETLSSATVSHGEDQDCF
jgi:tetratricopeptide (TPR) repeat protein